jgi:hypothetical protein
MTINLNDPFYTDKTPFVLQTGIFKKVPNFFEENYYIYIIFSFLMVGLIIFLIFLFIKWRRRKKTDYNITDREQVIEFKQIDYKTSKEQSYTYEQL